MKNCIRFSLLTLTSMLAGAVGAQTTTGSNTSLTLPSPPRTMTSMPVASTPGVDSTFQGNVMPNLQSTNTVRLPWANSNGGSSAAAAAAPVVKQQSRALPASATAAGSSGH